MVGLFRKEVSIVQEDRVLQYYIHKASEFISTLEIDAKELF